MERRPRETAAGCWPRVGRGMTWSCRRARGASPVGHVRARRGSRASAVRPDGGGGGFTFPPDTPQRAIPRGIVSLRVSSPGVRRALHDDDRRTRRGVRAAPTLDDPPYPKKHRIVPSSIDSAARYKTSLLAIRIDTGWVGFCAPLVWEGAVLDESLDRTASC